MTTAAGTRMGRKEREWGQTGVMRTDGMLGCIIDDPVAAAYAVLPVGVDINNPADITAIKTRLKYQNSGRMEFGFWMDCFFLCFYLFLFFYFGWIFFLIGLL